MANRFSEDLPLLEDLPPKGGSRLTITCRRLVGFDLQVASAFRRKILIAGIIPLLAVTLFAQSPERSQTEALAKRAAERLAALQKEAESLLTQERGVLAELRK